MLSVKNHLDQSPHWSLEFYLLLIHSAEYSALGGKKVTLFRTHPTHLHFKFVLKTSYIKKDYCGEDMVEGRFFDELSQEFKLVSCLL